MSDADEVEVFVTFEKTWVPGYELCGVSADGDEETYVLRRQSDGEELPEALPGSRIRPANSAPSAPERGV